MTVRELIEQLQEELEEKGYSLDTPIYIETPDYGISTPDIDFVKDEKWIAEGRWVDAPFVRIR